MPIVAKLDELGRPAWIALMVLGFVAWWPAGLAILAFIIGSGRMSCWNHHGWSHHGMDHWQRKIGRLERAITTMAQVLAWAHLRGSGRQGAAIPDAVVDFGRERRWAEQALGYADQYATKVARDWQEFRRMRPT